MWKKVIAPTALVSMLWLAVGGATIYYMNWIYHSHTKDLSEKFTSIQAADAMQDVLWRLQATAMEVAERADSHTQIEISELENAFEKHLAEAAAGSISPEEKTIIEEIRNQYSKYRKVLHRRLDSDSTSNEGDSMPVEMAHIAHTITNSCKGLLQINEKFIAESTAQRSKLRANLDFAMIILWIIGPIIGIIWGLWAARRLRRSISQVSISLKDAAGGLDREVGCFELHPSDDLPILHQQVQLVATRIQQVMEELEQARREAMLADRLAVAGELAAGVAHELRNPLTSVKLLIQNAEERFSDTPLSKEHLHVVLEQIVRMENTIQGLLDFARPPQMETVRHDLRDTLRLALNLVEGHAKQQDVEFVEDYPKSPVYIDGDPEQLHQVFVNLLLNGIESMPEGGELKVAVQCDLKSCQVSFEDSGVGIPQSILDRMFEPFVTNKERGTGLGLAISRRIVIQHSGKIYAANRDERGAIFTVELPLSRENI